MDDELNYTKINDNATYTRLGTIPTEVNPCYELQQRENIDQSATKEVKQTSTNEASNSNAVLITMIVILLLLTLTSQTKDISPQTQSQCGLGLWWRVAYLDMTDQTQQCPLTWREYNTSGVKACGRPANSTGSCAAEFMHACGSF